MRNLGIEAQSPCPHCVYTAGAKVSVSEPRFAYDSSSLDCQEPNETMNIKLLKNLKSSEICKVLLSVRLSAHGDVSTAVPMGSALHGSTSPFRGVLSYEYGFLLVHQGGAFINSCVCLICSFCGGRDVLLGPWEAVHHDPAAPRHQIPVPAPGREHPLHQVRPPAAPPPEPLPSHNPLCTHIHTGYSVFPSPLSLPQGDGPKHPDQISPPVHTALTCCVGLQQT